MLDFLIKHLDKKPKETKLIFVSHPYASNPELNWQKVQEPVEYIARQGYIPISPLHLFRPLKDDKYRKTILWICAILIMICDEVWIYGNSKGCKYERRIAQLLKKKIRIMYNDSLEKFNDIECKYLMEEKKGVKM